MFVDFLGTVARVAEWAGLPQHDFEYDQHEFSGTCSRDSRRRHRPDFFADGGRYETLVYQVESFATTNIWISSESQE